MGIKHQTKGVAITSCTRYCSRANDTRGPTNILHNYILFELCLQNGRQYPCYLIYRATRRENCNDLDGALAWPITCIALSKYGGNHAKRK